MTQRFGGKYSPGAKPGPGAAPPPLASARPARAGARSNLLFVLPFILPVTGFLQGPVGLSADLAAFGILMLAAWLTREGERAHEAWEARAIARRPAIPRKIFASVLTALGVGLAAWAPGAGLLAPVLLGAFGGVLHLVSFGPDPMSDKGMQGTDAFQTERVATAVAEAERHLTAMREAARPVADREIMDKLDRFAATARAMFRTLENDPRDLTAARKYLSVYLDGARAATARFAQIQTASRDPKARADYAALLEDLDTRFAQRTEVLLSNDRTRLDVEIEVLRERLAQDAPRL
ncbi:MAG: 5-bromo-4-chloroindolyl phosphate hydrolysis family protein [Gemmobacter sp.]|jgi:hypothetical protein|nr:5-bromo-4-chloroindolyl phosphate hydrolysis family protein [Gemmobacter sp.]